MSFSIPHMPIRVLQLNIQKGSRLPAVIAYIKKHAFDIVCLQEVAGGPLAYNHKDCYTEILETTGLLGEVAVSVRVRGDPSSYIGVATFYRPEWQPIASRTVWLKRYQEIPRSDRLDARTISRCALVTILARGNDRLMVINTHLAWGPTPNDTLYKKNQAEKLYQWIRHHRRDPFLLVGDFNLNPNTNMVSRLSSLGVNLTKRYRVTNTLNPRTHYAKHLFPSGLPVDYIITDRRLHIKKFFVEETADLSDHYGLIVEFQV